MNIRAETQIRGLVGDWEPLKVSDVARSGALGLLGRAVDGLGAVEARGLRSCRLLCSGVCLVAAIVLGHASHSTAEALVAMYGLLAHSANAATALNGDA